MDAPSLTGIMYTCAKMEGCKNSPFETGESIHMKNCKLVSIDLAKNVFQVCLFDHASNKVISNRKVTRSKFLDYLRRLPLEATVAQFPLLG